MQKNYRLRSIGGKERQPLGAVLVLGERESNARASSFSLFLADGGDFKKN